MKKLVFFLFSVVHILVYAQQEYEPSDAHPYGQPNPNASKEIMDYHPLIGKCDCTSTTRNKDKSWATPNKMTWEFKYIMNGMAVQDQTIKEDGKHSGSIRQFIADSSKWFVHYYSSTTPSFTLSTWKGNKQKDKIILYRKQKAPNGTDGFYKISFHNITKNGFQWLGEWVNTKETFSYPTWKISCKKRTKSKKLSDRAQIIAVAKAFSLAYINKDYEALARSYTHNAKIFPNNTSIISGYEAIKKRWSNTVNYTPISHQIITEEITIQGDTAYDYGYYNGKNKNQDGTITSYKGKYVVVWKKINNQWKMHLDIWNNVKN